MDRRGARRYRAGELPTAQPNMKRQTLAALAVDTLVVGLWVAVALAATETLCDDVRLLESDAPTTQALRLARAAQAASALATP